MKLELDGYAHTDSRRLLPKRIVKLLIIVASVVVLAAAGAAAGAIVASNILGGVKVPAAILQKAKSSVYVPTKLPGAYVVVDDSYSFEEDTLIFTASDSAGSKLVFTEQVKPKDLNFDDFYKENFKDAKTLSGVPYPSVMGKATTGDRTLLSIVADDTWVLVSTISPLSQDEMQAIAAGMKRTN